jgi:hypothetical protein
MRHKLYLDKPTQVGVNKIMIPKVLQEYYGNNISVYINGSEVKSFFLKGIRYVRDWINGNSEN